MYNMIILLITYRWSVWWLNSVTLWEFVLSSWSFFSTRRPHVDKLLQHSWLHSVAVLELSTSPWTFWWDSLSMFSFSISALLLFLLFILFHGVLFDFFVFAKLIYACFRITIPVFLYALPHILHFIALNSKVCSFLGILLILYEIILYLHLICLYWGLFPLLKLHLFLTAYVFYLYYLCMQTYFSCTSCS